MTRVPQALLTAARYPGIALDQLKNNKVFHEALHLQIRCPTPAEYGEGTILEMIPREAGSPDPVPQRAKMLKGCEIYITGAPCAMCMSAIYWSRIDRVYFASTLADTSAIGFDDAFQYEDFTKPWDKRRIAVSEAFERDLGLKAFKAWTDKKDRHPY